MRDYEHDRVLHKLQPLRPIRQSCVICRSSPYALNLAADFIIAVIKLEFDLTDPPIAVTEKLFPSKEKDSFLAAMSGNIEMPSEITEFF